MKIKNVLLVLAVLIPVFVNVCSFNKTHDWGDDFAGYVIQAKTISSGDYQGLAEDARKNDYILNYPWGFPLLISPLISTFDNTIITLKQYIYLFFIAGLLLTFLLFKEEKKIAFFTTLLMASSPYFWEFKNYILADFPNLCFVLLSLYFAQATLSGKYIINPYVSWILTGVFIYISYMIRNQSIVLLPTLILVQLIHYKKDFFSLKRLSLVLLPSLIFILLLATFSFFQPLKSVTYLDQYSNLQLRKTVWENIFYYMHVWQELVTTTDVINKFTGIFTGFLLVFGCVGLTTNLKSNSLYIVFFSLSMALVLVSPFHQGVRYLIPLVPFFFYFFVSGLKYAFFKIYPDTRVNQMGFLAIVISVILLNLKTILVYSYQASVSTIEAEGPYKTTSKEMFKFIRENTADNQIIGFWKPRAMLLYTGRNSVVPGSYADCLNRNVNYFVYYKKTTDQLALEELEAHTDQLSMVFKNEDFMIYKVK